MCGRGHKFRITARNKEVSQILLEKYQLSYVNRGKGSSNLLGKIAYTLKADFVIFRNSLDFKPDIFLSFTSPYAAHIARILCKPHISFTDTENAKLGILSFAPFTECILTPEVFQGNFGKKHIRFNGFMELCYLNKSSFVPNVNTLSEINIKPNEPYAFLRFVSWGANHDIGHAGIQDNEKLHLVKELSKKLRVIISAEGQIPLQLTPFKVSISPEKIHDLLAFAAIYIGEGATMASECAMLGTPAIYVNSLSSGTLEDQENHGLLYGFRNYNKVYHKALEIIDNPVRKEQYKNLHQHMLADKIDVTAFMVWFIENYPSSARTMRENPDYQYNFK
jgi:predicted glycosyltransferase